MMYQKVKISVLPPPLYKCIVVLCVAIATLALVACSVLAEEGAEKKVRISLPPIESGARSISDDRIPDLKGDVRRYRVTVNGTTREGTGSSYEFTLPVGVRASVTVECLNSNGDVIIRAVKDFTVAGGDNNIDINLKADGNEIIPSAPQPVPNQVTYSWGAANNGGEKRGLPANEKVAAGETFTVPDVSQTIYWAHGAFTGWSASVELEPENGAQATNAPIAGERYKMPKGGVTLTALWSDTWYTINYDMSLPGGGSGLQASGGAPNFSMAESDNKALSTSSDNSGQYAFKGWATASGASAVNISGTEAIRTAVASGTLQISQNNDITLYAVWAAAPYTINYTVASNEGTGSHSQDFSMADTNVTLYNGSGFNRTGYNLAGWNYSGGSSNAGNKGDSVSPSDLIQNKDQSGNTVTLTASWEAIQYTINVVPNGATQIISHPFASNIYTVDSSTVSGNFTSNVIDLADLSSDEYVYSGKLFKHWSFTANGPQITSTDPQYGTGGITIEEVLNNSSAQISSSNVITLYPVWADAVTFRLYSSYYHDRSFANGVNAESGNDDIEEKIVPVGYDFTVDNGDGIYKTQGMNQDPMTGLVSKEDIDLYQAQGGYTLITNATTAMEGKTFYRTWY